MHIWFLSILLITFIVEAVVSTLSEKKYRNVFMAEKIKCKNYYQTITVLWGIVFVIFIMCLIGGISLTDIGLRWLSFNYNLWLTAISLVISGLFILILLLQSIQLVTSTKAQEDAKKKIATGEGAGQMLPRTKKEKRLFVLVSLTAGICEEIIFRGFLVFLLQAIFSSLPIYLIVIISSVIFGLVHLYQGWQGIIKTGVIGAFLMCLVLVTNSLIISMLLHFLMDVSSVFLLSEEQAE